MGSPSRWPLLMGPITDGPLNTREPPSRMGHLPDKPYYRWTLDSSSPPPLSDRLPSRITCFQMGQHHRFDPITVGPPSNESKYEPHHKLATFQMDPYYQRWAPSEITYLPKADFSEIPHGSSTQFCPASVKPIRQC